MSTKISTSQLWSASSFKFPRPGTSWSPSPWSCSTTALTVNGCRHACTQRSTRWPGNSVFFSILKTGFIPPAIRRTQLVSHKKENPEAKLYFSGFPLKKKKFIQMFKIVVILVETCCSNVTCVFWDKSIFSIGTFSAWFRAIHLFFQGK